MEGKQCFLHQHQFHCPPDRGNQAISVKLTIALGISHLTLKGIIFLKLYFHSFTNSNTCMFLWHITNDTRKLRLLTVVNMTIPRKLKKKLCLLSLLTEIFSPTSKQVLHSNYSLSDKSPFSMSSIWNRPKKLTVFQYSEWDFGKDVELFWISTLNACTKIPSVVFFFFYLPYCSIFLRDKIFSTP